LAQSLRLAEYQSLLGEPVREYLAGMTALVKSGNVFAMYEKMKFYASNSDSLSDAKALFAAIEKRGDGDALLILGRCFREGVGVEQNHDMAKYYFYNAWQRGSEVAKSELEAEMINGNQNSGATA